MKFDKPIYLGAIITELAKLHMYRFYYNHVGPTLGKRQSVAAIDDRH